MSKNRIVLLISIIVGIIYGVYAFTQPIPDDGWLAIAQTLGVFYGVIAISIVFGILGFILVNKIEATWGKRFKQAFSWLGISLLVILVITVIVGLLLAPARKAEWDKTHPQIQNYDSNTPNYKAPIE